MKHLVVLCYPLTESLGQLIGAELALLYDKYKVEIELRDLYKIGFNPVLCENDLNAMKSGEVLEDVANEQQYITDAEVIMFIYPVWWTGMPAMLRGYIERIFSEGFAFSRTKKGVKKLLEGKKVVLVNTYKQSDFLFNKGDFYDNSGISEKHIFQLFGMDIILHYFFDDTNNEEDYARNVLKVKMQDLKIEIKKAIFVANNSRLNIPTTFF